MSVFNRKYFSLYYFAWVTCWLNYIECVKYSDHISITLGFFFSTNLVKKNFGFPWFTSPINHKFVIMIIFIRKMSNPYIFRNLFHVFQYLKFRKEFKKCAGFNLSRWNPDVNWSLVWFLNRTHAHIFKREINLHRGKDRPCRRSFR